MGIFSKDKDNADEIPDELPSTLKLIKEEVENIDFDAEKDIEEKDELSDNLKEDFFLNESEAINNDLDEIDIFDVEESEIISKLNERWEKQKLIDRFKYINDEISKAVAPLKELEQEWCDLKKSLLDIQSKLTNTENQIKSRTSNLKMLYIEREDLKNQLEGKSEINKKTIKKNKDTNVIKRRVTKKVKKSTKTNIRNQIKLVKKQVKLVKK